MNLFEDLQSTKRLKRNKLEEKIALTVSDYNQLKTALNKHNTMRGNFILHPGEVTNYSRKSSYKFDISVYGAFRTFEQDKKNYVNPEINNANTSRNGRGAELYKIHINLIDETITFDDYYYYLKSYISQYERSLLDKDEINKNELDTKLLYDNIVQISEKSKIDVEKLLKSKNFIYKLSGKDNLGKETDYTLDLDESTKLTEDFDSSMPKWLKIAIKTKNSEIRGHSDYKYRYNLDSLKWTVETFPEKGKLENISNNEIYAFLIDRSGDAHSGNYVVYAPSLYIGDDLTIEINGRNRRIDSMSLKALAPYVKEFAHAIDSEKSYQNVLNTQQSRASAGRGSIDRVKKQSVFGGQIDKSGYIVDPEKYKRKLAQLHKTDYVSRLEDLYVVLTGCKNKIKELITRDDFLPDAKDTSSKFYTIKHDSPLYRFDDIRKYYVQAVYDYNYALNLIDKIASQQSDSYYEPYKEFTKYVSSSEAYIVKVLDIIDK